MSDLPGLATNQDGAVKGGSSFVTFDATLCTVIILI